MAYLNGLISIEEQAQNRTEQSITFQRKKRSQMHDRHEELMNISKTYHERQGAENKSFEPAFENAELLLQNRRRIINEQATDVIKKRSKTQLNTYK